MYASTEKRRKKTSLFNYGINNKEVRNGFHTLIALSGYKSKQRKNKRIRQNRFFCHGHTLWKGLGKILDKNRQIHRKKLDTNCT